MGSETTDPLARLLQLAGRAATDPIAAPAAPPPSSRQTLAEATTRPGSVGTPFRPKRLRDYMREAVAAPPSSTTSTGSSGSSSTMAGTGPNSNPNDPETIGTDRTNAIKNLQARLGPQATASKAQQTFDKLKGAGAIKQSGTKVTMAPMGDEDFKQAIGEDEGDSELLDEKPSGLFIDWNAGRRPRP